MEVRGGPVVDKQSRVSDYGKIKNLPINELIFFFVFRYFGKFSFQERRKEHPKNKGSRVWQRRAGLIFIRGIFVSSFFPLLGIC